MFVFDVIMAGSLLLQNPPAPPPQTPGTPRPQTAPSPPGTPQPTPQPAPMPQPGGVPQPGQQPGSPINPQPGQQPGSPIKPNLQNPNQQIPQTVPQGRGTPNGQTAAVIRSLDINRNQIIVSQPGQNGQTFARFTVPASATFRTADNQLLTGRFQSTMFENPAQLSVPVQLSFNASGQISEIRLLDAIQEQPPPQSGQTRPNPLPPTPNPMTPQVPASPAPKPSAPPTPTPPR